MHRNTSLFLKSAILAVFVCFVLQGVFGAYVSALPDTNVHAGIFKEHAGVKSSPEIKKPIKMVAVPGYATGIDPLTGSSQIDSPYSFHTAVSHNSTVTARAPPAPLI